MRRHSSIAAAAALALVGCAEDSGAPRESADQRLVRVQAEQFLAVMEARQDAKACRMMTRTLQQGISFSLERRSLPGTAGPARPTSTRRPSRPVMRVHG